MPRARVVDLFRQAVDSPLTLVNAPIGYGKSVAVQEFLRGNDTPHAYVHFDGGDDRDSSWHKLLVELERADIAPDLGTIGQLLGDPESVDRGRLAALEEAERLDDTALVVLDGLDRIDDPRAVAEFSFFANRLPSKVRLVALTQRPLGLPVARWRAQSRLAEIDADDLRFDYGEAATFLQGLGAEPTADAHVKALTDRVEGWPLGLDVVARWMAEGRGTADLAEAEALVRSILDPLPSEVQEFLLATSVLTRFDAALCRAVVGREDAGSLLEYVEDANLFLVPLDDHPGWFRYRRFFAELLRGELDRRRPGVAPQLHQRAAEWWKGQGDMRRAIRHLMESGRKDEALALVNEDVYRPRAGGLVGVDWEAVFTPQWIADDPMRMVQFATLLGRSGAVERAKVWIDRADAATADAAPGDPRRVVMLTVKALWYGLHLDARAAVELGEQALANDDGTLSLVLLERLYAVLAVAQLALGQVDEADRLVGELDRVTQSGVVHDVVVPAMRARQALVAGQLRRAEDLARHALRIAAAMDMSRHPVVREAHVALGGVLAERGQLDAAETSLVTGIRSADSRGWMAVAAEARLLLAQVHLARDGPAAALATLTETRASLDGVPAGPEPLAALDAAEARVLILAGELDRARELVAALPDGLPRTLLRVRLELPHGDLAVAADALETADPRHVRDRIVAKLLAARVAGNEVRPADRDRALLEAAHLGWPEGFVTVYVEEAPRLMRRMRELVESDRRLGAMGQAFETLETGGAEGPSSAALTDRELEVLRYLRSNMTKPEIAGQLDITANTLKSHVRGLYRKLGASSRAEAVAIARKTGLL